MIKWYKVWVLWFLFFEVLVWLEQYVELYVEVIECVYLFEWLCEWLVGVDVVIIGFFDCVDVVILVDNYWLWVIVNLVVGYNNLDIDVFICVGVFVCNILDVFNEIIVDYVWVLLLVVVWCVGVVECWLCVGQWIGVMCFDDWLGVDLYGKMLGILGMGCIGQVVVCCVVGFDMCVLYYNCICLFEVVECQCVVCWVDKVVLLCEFDYLVLVLLYMLQNYYVIGVVELVQMKCGSVLVNIVWGGLVDEVVLVVLLVVGYLVVVGLDVYEDELVVYLVLLVLEQVVFSLYLGSVSVDICCNMVKLVVDNVLVGLGVGLDVGCLFVLINLQVFVV